MGTKGLNSRYIGILGRFYLSPAFRIVPWEGDKRGQNDAKALCMGGVEGTNFVPRSLCYIIPFYWTKTSYHDKI